MRLLISLLSFRRSKISSSMTLVNGLVLIPEDKIGVVRGDKVVMMLDWGIVEKSKVGKTNFRRKA